MSNPSPSFDANALYASVDGRMAGLGTDEAVFFDTASGRSQVMTRDVAQAFGLCRAFAPVETHVARIIAAIPALKGQAEAVRRVLGMLLANGLMQSDADFRARFQVTNPSVQAPVAGLFLQAPAELAQLRTTLQALADHAQQHGANWPIHVLDPATDAAAVPERAAAVAELARTHSAPVRHIDARAVARLLDTLAGHLPEQAMSLRWLLSAQPGSEGSARNLAALLGAGSRYLFLPANLALPLLLHPEAGTGLYADARALATRSFASAKALAAVSAAPAVDFLDTHLAICGLSLAEAMAAEDALALQRESLEGVVAGGMPWLTPDQRIACTTVGWAGPAGQEDPNLIFRLAPAARTGLVSTREEYLAGYRNPLLWQGLNRFGLGLGQGLVPLAYDASRMIPCTVPDAPRTADLQLQLLRLADPRGVDLDFPQALTRIHAVDTDDALGRPDLAQCLGGLAQVVAQDLYADSADLRLDVLAAKLTDLAAADSSGLQAYLGEYLAWYRSSTIEVMQNALTAGAPAPVYWVADLRAAVEAQGRALIGGEVPRLAGWPATFDADACVARFRADVEAFAAGLRAWPVAFAWAHTHSADWRAGLD